MEVDGRITSVALVSPCKMIHSAMHVLFNNPRFTLTWQFEGYEKETLIQLAKYPVDFLFLTLHTHWVDLLHGIHLIKVVKMTYPNIRLIVVMDDPIPYLVSCLQHYRVDQIIDMRMSLANWQRLSLLTCTKKLKEFIELSQQYQEVGKKTRLTVMELCVIRYLVQGFSISEIATLVQSKVKTVHHQKARAMQKIGINNYAQLIAVRSVLMDSLDAKPELWLPSGKMPSWHWLLAP
ncbi:LuxR C-terminal-related transcriptional regulator [Serratia fonticola]